MFQVELGPHAAKFLSKLRPQPRARIEARLKRLRTEPVPSDAKFLGRDERNNRVFRYRIGDYRALYNIREEAGTIIVIIIDKRDHIYD